MNLGFGAVPWLRRLVAVLLPRGPSFNPRRVNVILVMVTVALGWALSKYFSLPLSVSFHQCSMLIFIYMFLSEFRWNVMAHGAAREGK
jgi:hypothetical protein